MVVLLTITSVRKKYNWELVYCELYAGGKYNNNGGDNYEYSLGLNGLGACATQYSSEFMDVEVFRDGYKYDLHFEKGRNVGGLKRKRPSRKRQVQRHTGDLILKFSRILKLRTNILRTF